MIMHHMVKTKDWIFWGRVYCDKNGFGERADVLGLMSRNDCRVNFNIENKPYPSDFTDFLEEGMVNHYNSDKHAVESSDEVKDQIRELKRLINAESAVKGIIA